MLNEEGPLGRDRGHPRRGLRRGTGVGPAVRHDHRERAAGRSRQPRRGRPRCRRCPRRCGSGSAGTIAVKCDAPPFGYIDVQGRNAGFDVEIARWFSRFAFGRSNRVSFTCITTPAREASLQSKRVDLVIATYTWTAARDNIIDFSRAYYKATGRLLVRNDSPIRSVADLGGKTIATTRGSIYDRWVGNCFKSSNLLVTDSFTNALLAFRDGRADTLMWDDSVLARDRDCRPDAEADRRPVPAAALRDRDPAGEHRDEAVGRLAAEHHAQAGRLLPDHEGERAGAATWPGSRRTSCARTSRSSTTRGRT